MSRKGKIYVVGIGPGNKDNMTFRAYKVIENADIMLLVLLLQEREKENF